jgi:acetyl-CoA C-acetyltransferase/acetyl-CoA acyltransferase
VIGERDALVIGGVRTPFVRSFGPYSGIPAIELGRIAVREAVERTGIDPDSIDEVIVGNVSGQADAANIARAISLLAKVPRSVPAFTVNRGCASGFESIVEAAYRIRAGDADLVVAAAVESMSCIPLLFGRDGQVVWTALSRARGLLTRLAAMARFRLRHFRPVAGLKLGLIDPVSGLNMGETAEILAREFAIGREEQDAFAQRSHERAAAAWNSGRMAGEVVPVPVPPAYERMAVKDDGVREGAGISDLVRLRPVFDPEFGTITAGNSAQISDGAVALVIGSAKRAAELGLEPAGKLRSWAFAGCDPARMGLGPLFSTPPALRRAGGLSMERIDLVEINEAFAAQILACMEAFGSRSFSERWLGSEPVGTPDMDRVNVNGGAIALGHPVGASGARLVLTLLEEMKQRDLSLGLATLCIGGGQGGSIIVERS